MKHFENCIDKLQIAGVKTKVHKDECNDGDARPDLDCFMIGGKKKWTSYLISIYKKMGFCDQTNLWEISG